MHETILRLPDVYETELGGRGALLSVGQQRESRSHVHSMAFVGGPRPESNSNLNSEAKQAGDERYCNVRRMAGECYIIPVDYRV